MTLAIPDGAPEAVVWSGATGPTGWSRTDRLAFGRWGGGAGLVSPNTSSKPQWRAGSPTGDISPDGRYMLLSTDVSGRFEVVVEEIDGPFRRQISTDGGIETVWCGNCNDVFYRNGNRIFASRITLGPTPEFGAPRVAFVADEFIDTPGKSFDISSDGSRLYYVRRTSPIDRASIHVVQNWFDELRQLVPRK